MAITTNKELLKEILEKITYLESAIETLKNKNQKAVKTNNKNKNWRPIDSFYLKDVDKYGTSLDVLYKVNCSDFDNNISLADCRKYFKPPYKANAIHCLISVMAFNNNKEFTSSLGKDGRIKNVRRIQDLYKYIGKADKFKVLDTPVKLDKLMLKILENIAGINLKHDKNCEVSHIVTKSLYDCGLINFNVVTNRTKLFYDVVKFFNLGDIEYKSVRGNNYISYKEMNKIKNNAIKKVGNKKTTDKVKVKNNRIKILPPNDVKLMDVIKEINLFEEQENKSGASARAKRV